MSRHPAAVRVLHAPKHGHAPDEYEDAWAVSDGPGLPLHAAVADGATESAFAGAWARLLAADFAGSAPASVDDFSARLPALRARFAAEVAAASSALPWYAAMKAEEGAYATLLGLSLLPEGAWRALAVGDAVLFHLSGSEERLRWPVDDPAAFGDRPDLVASLPERETRFLAASGTWRRGDAFVLATDALAAWLMQAGPAALLGMDEAAFAGAVEAARRERALRNDDVTAVLLSLSA